MTLWRVQNDQLIKKAKAWVWFINRSPCFVGTRQRTDTVQQSHSVVTLKDRWQYDEIIILHNDRAAGGTLSCLLRWEHAFSIWMKDKSEWWGTKYIGYTEYLSFETTGQLSPFTILISALEDWFVWATSQASLTLSWVWLVRISGRRSELPWSQCAYSHVSFLVSSL